MRFKLCNERYCKFDSCKTFNLKMIIMRLLHIKVTYYILFLQKDVIED